MFYPRYPDADALRSLTAWGVRVTLVGRSSTSLPVSPPRADFQVAGAWFAALGFSRGCPSALKQAVFIDSRSPPKPSEPSLGRHCTCDESIAVAVKDHDKDNDNDNVRQRRRAPRSSPPSASDAEHLERTSASVGL